MTTQEAFERGFYVQFCKNEPMVILLFQHKELYQEFYENIKEEVGESKLSLEIKIKNNFLQLLITNGEKILKSNDLAFNKDELDDFTKAVHAEQRISFFTDYPTFVNETAIPQSKWINGQQHDRIYLHGYKFTKP